MQIILQNNTTNYIQYYEDVDVKSDTPLYKSVQLKVNELLDGEYTLTLLNNANEIIQKELLRIGDYEIKNYKQEKKYTQYVRK